MNVTKSANILVFSLRIFMGTSVFWHVLDASKFRISFNTSSLSTSKNEKGLQCVSLHTSPIATLHKTMKFSIKDFFSKCEQIRSFQPIWSHLLKKSLMENFVFCVVQAWLDDFHISKLILYLDQLKFIRNYSFITYEKFSAVRVRIRGWEILVFRKLLRTYVRKWMIPSWSYYQYIQEFQC